MARIDCRLGLTDVPPILKPLEAGLLLRSTRTTPRGVGQGHPAG
jgi:hypothetical protein